MKEQLVAKVENIAPKGEIAHDEQFLLLPQCFKNVSAAEASESVCMWERINPLKICYFMNPLF